MKKIGMMKRILVIVLCLVMACSGFITTLAETTPESDSEIPAEEIAVEELEAEDPVIDEAEESIAEESETETAAEKANAEEAETESAAEEANAEEAETEPTAKEANAEETEGSEAEPAAESDAEETEETESTDAESTAAAEEESEEPEAESDAVPEGAVTELTYEDQEVRITVTAVGENAIPENAELKVTPIVKKKVTDDMTVEEQKKIEEINAEYVLTEEKLEEKFQSVENKGIAGFLAYDITFVVKDEKGNEVKTEPNGEVRVTFEYVNAVLPQEVQNSDTEATDVTVMHLEEDENGEVKNVVDMNESNQLEKIATTADTAVEAAEFTTESFSTFVITWTHEDAGKNSTITVICVNEAGEEISGGYNVEAPYNITINSSFAPVISGYTFREAYIAKTNDDGTVEKVCSNVKWMAFDSQANAWVYACEVIADGKTEMSGLSKWLNFGQGEKLYFEYGEAKTAATKQETVASRSKGIDIDLFNYNSSINNENRPFQFVGSTVGIDGGMTATNNLSADGFKQNVLQRQLDENGYPLLNSTDYSEASGKESLAYLFNENGTTTDGIAGVYLNLDGFFQEDEEGYLYYDSRTYHAQLDASNSRIDVYNAQVFPYEKAGIAGGFLPFNQLPTGALADTRYVLKDKTADYWMGLNVTARFIQPVNGKVKGNDMTFQFEGDDDMWVFIDGNLVLDIGGMHGPISGSINFATGEVHITTPNGVHDNTANPDYSDGVTPDTYIGEQYRKAGCSEETLKSIFKTGTDTEGNTVYTTFKDQTAHTIKVFYFERGSAESNCTIKFNLDPKDIGTAVVEKDADSTYDEIQNTTKKFKFKAYGRVYSENDSNLTPALLANTTFTLVKTDGTTVVSTTAADGTFELGAGEKARFENLRRNTEFYAEEVEVLEHGSNTVTVTGVTGPFTVTETDGIVRSGTVTISDTESIITFKNEATDELSVNKVWKWGNEELDVTEIPQTSILVGLYKSSDGTATGRYLELNKENNWTATFTQLAVSGSYTVKELREAGTTEKAEFSIDGKGYIGVEANEDVMIEGNGYLVSYSGNTIINTLQPMTLKIQKVSAGNQDVKLQGAGFELKNSAGTVVATGTSDVNGIIVFQNLKPGTYTLTETAAPAGYELPEESITVTLDGTAVNYEVTKTVTNSAIYELPSTGGSGIYLHVISGVLLMMAGTLMIYNKKRKEVLSR